MAQNLQEWVAPRRALGDRRPMHRRERDRCRVSAASKFIHNTRINNYETFSSAKMIPPWNNNNNHILLALNCKDGKKIMKWVVGPLLEAGRQNARLSKSCPRLHGIFWMCTSNASNWAFYRHKIGEGRRRWAVRNPGIKGMGRGDRSQA